MKLFDYGPILLSQLSDRSERNCQTMQNDTESHLMLKKMLAASAIDIRKRLRFPYEAIEDSDTRPIVLFGCGPLGRRTSAALVAAHRPPIAFADNNPAKWGGTIDGIPVLSPEAAVAAHGKTALFVVTIYNGAAARAQLQALGCRYTMHFAALYHALPDALLPWCDLDDPAETLAARAEVIDAATLWADDASRAEYIGQLAWRLGLSTPGLPTMIRRRNAISRTIFLPLAKTILSSIAGRSTAIVCVFSSVDLAPLADILASNRTQRVMNA